MKLNPKAPPQSTTKTQVAGEILETKWRPIEEDIAFGKSSYSGSFSGG